MSDFSDNIVNQRFNRVFQELEKYNLIKGKSDLAKRLGTYNHVINSILKGERNITVDQLAKLLDIFPVDANFLFGKSEQMYVENGAEVIGLPSFSMSQIKRTPRSNEIEN